MAFTGVLSSPLLLLLLLLLLACETTESQSISGGPLSDSPKCVSGFCLQKGYQEPYNERARPTSSFDHPASARARAAPPAIDDRVMHGMSKQYQR